MFDGDPLSSLLPEGFLKLIVIGHLDWDIELLRVRRQHRPVRLVGQDRSCPSSSQKFLWHGPDEEMAL